MLILWEKWARVKIFQHCVSFFRSLSQSWYWNVPTLYILWLYGFMEVCELQMLISTQSIYLMLSTTFNYYVRFWYVRTVSWSLWYPTCTGNLPASNFAWSVAYLLWRAWKFFRRLLVNIFQVKHGFRAACMFQGYSNVSSIWWALKVTNHRQNTRKCGKKYKFIHEDHSILTWLESIMESAKKTVCKNFQIQHHVYITETLTDAQKWKW